MMESLDGSWIELIGAGSGILATIAGIVAAVYAYKTYQQRPQLKLYIADENNQILYSDEHPDWAYVHATIANVGKVTAHNVSGRVEFEPGRVHPDKRNPTAGYPEPDPHIVSHSDNWATLYLGSLPVSREQAEEGTLHSFSFEVSPRHFIIPVRVFEEGRTNLSYWFVSDETEGIKDTVTLHFSKRTTG